ncbi:Serine-threonine/tyrosine-protein kinase [Theobroma cacao]|nr:Serine-threonine/tyrosine-protein kinase [Theobroma cacao]
MKIALHPSNLQSSRGIQGHDLPGKNSDKNQHKTHSVRNYFKAASRKLAGVFTGSLFRRRKKAIADINRKNNQVTRISFSTSTDRSAGSDVRSSGMFKSFDSYGSSNSVSGHIPTPDFSFEEICKATGNYSPGNKIGEGGFGTVYRGRLKDGSLVAVKRAKKDEYNQGFSLQFKNEILTLSKIEHLNLVRLLGFLEHGDEQIIVVEYVGNGNLREHLDGGTGLKLRNGWTLQLMLLMQLPIFTHTQAMKRLKEGEFVIAMDPRLRRSPASNMVVERVLKLAHQCLAPMRQSRPSMKKCAEVLWGIRKNFKEKASSSASHHSANFPDRDAKTNRQLFGIEEDESYGFISA